MMYVVFADMSFESGSLDCNATWNVTCIEPIATFSTKARAQRFINQIENDEYDNGTDWPDMGVVKVSTTLSHDPEEFSASLKRKLRKLKKDYGHR